MSNRLQALKLEAASVPSQSQGLKLQAKILKRKDPMTRVQAHKPMFLGASNKDKSIFCMLHVEANLVGGEANFVYRCVLQLQCKKVFTNSIAQ